MSFGEGEFEEVSVFGNEFKMIVPYYSKSIPKIMAREIIEVQPMAINEDFLALHQMLEDEIKKVFTYDEHPMGVTEFPEFFTEEEFNL